MPYIYNPKEISIEEYVAKRSALLKELSPRALFRNGYADEFYPFPIIHTQREVELFVRIQEVLHKALTQIVQNYFGDEDMQERVPLSGKVQKQLRRISSVPYRIGGIRPDYIYRIDGRPVICEINARFIFNAFFMSIYMNGAFKQAFPAYQGMVGIADLEKVIRSDLGNADIAVVKDREDGYDIHSFLLEYPRTKLFDSKDLVKAFKYSKTVVLELHQDEIEKRLKTICDAILSGKAILNDPRTIFIVHDKRLLSVLCDATIMKRYVSPSEAALLKKYIIPTYVRGAHGKMFAKASKEKVKWVGKKAISGKSDGLYIGKEKDASAWKSLLKRSDTLLQPYIRQKKFKFWDPLKRRNNEWYLAGVLPMWHDGAFGPGLYRVSHTHKHDFARFIQPMRDASHEE